MVKPRVEVYDVECLINFFSLTSKNIHTKEVKTFVIHKSRDNLNILYDFLEDKSLYLIGFNCLDYDSQLIEFILSKKKEWYYTYPDIEDVISELYNESQEVINRLFPKYPEWKLSIPHLDLYKINHYDNKNKATSLKSVEAGIRFPNLQDMPFSHTHYVLEEEIPNILAY